MYDSMLPHQDKRAEELGCESTDEGGGEPCEAVGLDELVEIDTEKLGSDAKMVSEVEVFSHLDDIVLLIRVLPSETKGSVKPRKAR